MRSNPGGEIPSDQVVGRGKLIQEIWGTLDQQSAILTAERRIGKTSIIKKMRSDGPPSKLLIYQDLEAIDDPTAFAEKVYKAVEEHLSLKERGLMRARRLLESMGGAEVGGVFTFPRIAGTDWKDVLEATIADVVERQGAKSVVFLWDEIPWMLQKIAHNHGERTAMSVLDALRSLRQTYPAVRMIFTGSIGLHHVLESLKNAGHANSPVNDMLVLTVPALAIDDAEDLADRLLAGEEIISQDPPALARAVATAVDGLPFFVHHVVKRLAQRDGDVDATAVAEVVTSCLVDPHDPWAMRHYVSRTKEYYTAAERPIALELLDTLSADDGGLSFDHLFVRLRAKRLAKDKELVRDVLVLLQRDHYVAQQADGRYRFLYPIVARSWRLQRGIGR